ncbi:MAG: bacteriohemerythrin [bacterium]
MSNKFVWTEEYSVGVVEIDEQHKKFLDICSSILSLVENTSLSDEEAYLKVGELNEYANYHLSTEEKDFEISKYPGALEHINVHDKFRRMVKGFEEQMQDSSQDKKVILKEMGEFSGNWLMNHILRMDKQYSECFHEHGIK